VATEKSFSRARRGCCARSRRSHCVAAAEQELQEKLIDSGKGLLLTDAGDDARICAAVRELAAEMENSLAELRDNSRAVGHRRTNPPRCTCCVTSSVTGAISKVKWCGGALEQDSERTADGNLELGVISYDPATSG